MSSHRKGRYRRRRDRKPIYITAALTGQFVAAMATGSTTLIGASASVAGLAVAWFVLRKFVRFVHIVKRVLALAFIGLGIALDKQTRQTFRETWEENTGLTLDDTPAMS